MRTMYAVLMMYGVQRRSGSQVTESSPGRTILSYLFETDSIGDSLALEVHCFVMRANSDTGFAGFVPVCFDDAVLSAESRASGISVEVKVAAVPQDPALRPDRSPSADDPSQPDSRLTACSDAGEQALSLDEASIESLAVGCRRRMDTLDHTNTREEACCAHRRSTFRSMILQRPSDVI